MAERPAQHRGAYLVPLAQIGRPPAHAHNATLQKMLWHFTDSLIDEAIGAAES